MAGGGHGVNFIEIIAGQPFETTITGIVVGAGLVGLGTVARARLSSAGRATDPEVGLGLRNVFELVAEFILMLGDNVMGRENRKYLPFIATIFFYIFAANLIGLVPGFSMPTDSVTFNAGIALVVFVMYNVWGVKEVGLLNYLKHFCGPVIFLAPLMIVIELIGHIARPLSLSLRLFGNMLGDHLVVQVFTDLTKFGIPVIFYFMGTFVCFMQAFVFSLLTMIYIRFAVTHDDSH